ncbi:hypothetical protein BDEG_22221 [Batrachochytrium dendrobatidis JEL423]|uniref:Uncharacterized protein n=1 Tax=Batrachochytrium dendrobatidis (strain JEL423) TaxID=403673 RepID=A0A177WE03_BATDL|nr:hypothetical protein BDEG_22221 [Batrachochytrium dendrobatidis JEL423]
MKPRLETQADPTGPRHHCLKFKWDELPLTCAGVADACIADLGLLSKLSLCGTPESMQCSTGLSVHAEGKTEALIKGVNGAVDGPVCASENCLNAAVTLKALAACN